MQDGYLSMQQVVTTVSTFKEIPGILKRELTGLYPPEEIQSFVFLLAEYILGLSKTEVLKGTDHRLSEKQTRRMLQAIHELKQYKPVQYIIGETIFFDIPIWVNPSVLIPRPETEELVHAIIQSPFPEHSKILDIGTGSGCIAIALAKHIKHAEVFAIDISAEAIQLAKKNATRNNAHVTFIVTDIVDDKPVIEEKFDVIVSNPPYITLSEQQTLNKNVLEYEPHQALFVQDDNPLFFYERIIAFSSSHLTSGGWLFFEINEKYGPVVAELCSFLGFFNTTIVKDINGKDRIVKAQIKE